MPYTKRLHCHCSCLLLRFVGAFVALFALALHSALVIAQDIEAVERRLGKAVHKGEISLEQASVMLESLKGFVRADSNELLAFKISLARGPELDALLNGVAAASKKALIREIRHLEGRNIDLDQRISILGALCKLEGSAGVDASFFQSLDLEQITSRACTLEPLLRTLGPDEIAKFSRGHNTEQETKWLVLDLLAGNETLANLALRRENDQRHLFLLQSEMANSNLSPGQWLSILDTQNPRLFAWLLISAADSLRSQDSFGDELQSQIGALVEKYPSAFTASAVRFLEKSVGTKITMKSPEFDKVFREIDGIPFVCLPGGASPQEGETGAENLLWVSMLEMPQAWVAKEFSAVAEMQDSVKGIAWVEKEVAAHRLSVSAAMRICNRLSELDGRAPYYLTIDTDAPEQSQRNELSNGFRIPTVSEWQRLASGGTTTDYFHGALLDANPRSSRINFHDYGWFRGESMTESDFRESGLKRPNSWGLFDVYGNVFEIAFNEEFGNFVGCGGASYFDARRCSSRSILPIVVALSAGLRPVAPAAR